MLSKRKLRNKSGGEGVTPEVIPIKKALRKPPEDQDELTERPVRRLRQRDEAEAKRDANEKEEICKQSSKSDKRNKSIVIDKVKSKENQEQKNEKEVKKKDCSEDAANTNDKKYVSVVGPIRMSDRKSGDSNKYGERILPLTIKISKTPIPKESFPSAPMDESIKLSPREKRSPKNNKSDAPPARVQPTDPETTIIKLVESPAFEELDITTKLEILDTSKKKLEEIKRKSQEQLTSKEVVEEGASKKGEDKKTSPSLDKSSVIIKKDPAVKEDTKDEPQKVEAKDEPEKIIEEKWKEGEKILCFHGPLIYEAKIQRLEIQNGIPKYFIHYHGWNKNWDEWVPEARMLKFCERNVEIQKDLCRAHEAKEKAKKLKQKQDHVFAIPKTPSPVPKKEERGRRKSGLKPKKREDNQSDEFLVKNGKQVNIKPPDSTVESEEQFRTKLEIKIKIPEELKSYIVDDWNQICKKRRLCVLPAKITADQLINEYTRAKTLNKAEKMKNNKEKAIIEVTAGVREYFNVMISSQLLYKHEKSQYDQLIKSEPNMVPCKTYGVVHLLRLFTKLGEMLIYTPLSEKSINLLLFYVNDMLMYMKRNASLIFSLADYTQDAPM